MNAPMLPIVPGFRFALAVNVPRQANRRHGASVLKLSVSALTSAPCVPGALSGAGLLRRAYVKISPSRLIEASARSCGNPGHWQRMMK